jgi:hypothetical protein
MWALAHTFWAGRVVTLGQLERNWTSMSAQYLAAQQRAQQEQQGPHRLVSVRYDGDRVEIT